MWPMACKNPTVLGMNAHFISTNAAYFTGVVLPNWQYTPTMFAGSPGSWS